MPRIQLTWNMALSSLAVAVFAVGCAGSASELTMNRSGAVQAAEAEVLLSEEGNGNTEVRVQVENLPPANELSESAETYVVWAQDPESGEAHNLGALEVGKNGRGEMETLTPLKRFDIYITAEPISSAKTPTGERALWASVAQQ